jgi:hypothetical protein
VAELIAGHVELEVEEAEDLGRIEGRHGAEDP